MKYVPPKSGPGPASPANNAPKAPSSAVKPAPKGSTRAGVNEAWRRRREKDDDLESEQSRARNIPWIASPFDLEFLPLLRGDLEVLASSRRRVARNGESPYSLLYVRVANRSNQYVSVQDLSLEGPPAEPLDPKDPQPMRRFPVAMERFPVLDRLVKPVPPHSVPVHKAWPPVPSWRSTPRAVFYSGTPTSMGS